MVVHKTGVISVTNAFGLINAVALYLLTPEQIRSRWIFHDRPCGPTPETSIDLDVALEHADCDRASNGD